MDTVYRDFLDVADRQRIERLEIFDEFEEWHMIQAHYCITYGINDSKGLFKDFGFKKQAVPFMVPSFPSAKPLPCAD